MNQKKRECSFVIGVFDRCMAQQKLSAGCVSGRIQVVQRTSKIPPETFFIPHSNASSGKAVENILENNRAQPRPGKQMVTRISYFIGDVTGKSNHKTAVKQKKAQLSCSSHGTAHEFSQRYLPLRLFRITPSSQKCGRILFTPCILAIPAQRRTAVSRAED